MKSIVHQPTKTPTIVIVGQPNVGKSTLFNVLIGKKKSIVYDEPGVTRDYVFETTRLHDHDVTLVDTGGLDFSVSSDFIQKQVQEKIKDIIQEAAGFLVVFDAKAGLTHKDRDVMSALRKFNKPMVGVLNKAADPGVKGLYLEEFLSLGLKNCVEVSAEHKVGLIPLVETMIDVFQLKPSQVIEKKEVIKVAMIGKPNVGKSSIINRLLKEPRMIVSDVPGTTRDTVDTELQFQDHTFVLLDTAGMRKKSKVHDDIEFYSVVRSSGAIEEAHVVVLVLDPNENMTVQDQKIASLVVEEGKGLVIVANKWDLMNDSDAKRDDFRKEAYARSHFLSFADLRFISAKTGEGFDSFLPAVRSVMNRFKKTFSEDDLKELYQAVSTLYPQANMTEWISYQRMNFLSRPVPSFYIRCKRPDKVSDEIKQFWKNAIYQLVDLRGVPIRVVFHKERLKEFSNEGSQK